MPNVLAATLQPRSLTHVSIRKIRITVLERGPFGEGFSPTHAGSECWGALKAGVTRLERDGDRVRLITRGGYSWTDRYPWIVEERPEEPPPTIRARRRGGGARGRWCRRFQRAAFAQALTTRCSYTRSTALPLTATTCAACRYRCARPILTDSWRGARTASLSRRSSRAR